MILDTIKQRLHASLLRPAPTKAALADAVQLAADLGEDGAWSDVDYACREWAKWDACRHLERALALARARHLCSGELDAALTRAMDFWLGNDFQNPNWWHNRIGVPRLVGSVALLYDDGLTAGAKGKAAEILARAHWSHWNEKAGWADWTGANLIWMAYNVTLRGCLENIPALCETAFARVYAEIGVAPIGGEGIQADMSFHQHGPLLHSGGYGLDFAEDCARFLALTHGTPWQASTECLRLFAAFVLEGLQWMMRGGVIDPGAMDREMTREPRDLAGVAAAIEHLGELAITPRRAELAAFARRLRGAEEGLDGHRHYWRSDFAVHQRPAYYASVRMSSVRTVAAECCNGEGKQSHHVADGLTYILRRGDEYRDIFPVWDWRRLPGTTSLQSPAAPAADTVARRGGGRFVGGVSDGEYGLAVMELDRDGLQARKAWFHFDDSFVCLGAAIRCGDAGGPVWTSINQSLLRGPVTAYGKGGETHVLALDKGYDLSAARRLEHDGVTYHFPTSMPVKARLSAQTGSWAAIGTGSDEKITKDVFSMWIDHGTQPGNETYAYTVLPLGGDAEARRKVEHEISQIEILANTAALQAVRHKSSRLVGIVFWEPGLMPLPGGSRVAVNRPCILLCQDRQPAGKRLSIANPTYEATTVHVEYAGRCLCFDLPGGLKGGQSITRVL